MSSTGLRGHEFKLYKPQAHLDIRKNFFLPSELLMSGIDCLSHYCTARQFLAYMALDAIYFLIDNFARYRLTLKILSGQTWQ